MTKTSTMPSATAARRLPLSDAGFFVLAITIWFAVPVLGMLVQAG